jgi:hypothetical protein
MLGPLDEPLHIPKLDLVMWLLLVAICSGAVYGSLHASKGLAQSFNSNRKKIEAAEKSLEKAAKPGKGGAKPNAAAKKQVDAKDTALQKKLIELWQELYDRQQKVLVWPKIADLPESVDPGKLKSSAELPGQLCKAYNEAVMRSELERIFGKLGLRCPVPPNKEAAIENLPFKDRPADYEGLVAWDPKSREAIISRYHLKEGVPSSARVRIWQQDLWLFESLVDAVSSLNESARDPFTAPLKEIDKLEVAQWAVAAAGQNAASIWLPDATAAVQAAAPAAPAADADDAALVAGRYLDAKGQPLAAGAKQPFSEFKQVFVYLKLVIDQRRLDDLLAALANAPLPVETRSVVVQVPPDATVRVAPPADDDSASTAVPAPTEEKSPTDSIATAERTPWDVTVEIGGVVYLYNRPSSKKLGAGAAKSPGKRGLRLPVSAGAP